MSMIQSDALTNEIGAYLKDISNSPEAFFKVIVTEIRRGSRPRVPPSRVEFFSGFREKGISGEQVKGLSDEQVDKLVNLTDGWDISEEGLEEVKALARTWHSKPSSFFKTKKPLLTGNDGLIEFCFEDANHADDTTSTRQKFDYIILDKALQHKENNLRKKYAQGGNWKEREGGTFRSEAVNQFSRRRFGDLPEKERKSKHRKIKDQRVTGFKWSCIEPPWMILTLKDTKANCFGQAKFEGIEISAVNEYVRHLKGYEERDILKPAYSSILREYRRRSQRGHPGEGSDGADDVGWIDDILDPDERPASPPRGVEDTDSPLTATGDNPSDIGLPTPSTGSQAGPTESVSANSSQSPQHHPNNPPWTGLEQTGQVVAEYPPSPGFVRNDGLHQSNRNVMERGHEMGSGWLQCRDARDDDAADAAAALSQLHSSRALLPEASRTAEQHGNKRPHPVGQCRESQRRRLSRGIVGDDSIPNAWSGEAGTMCTRNTSGISQDLSYSVTEGSTDSRQQLFPENQTSRQCADSRSPGAYTTSSNMAQPPTGTSLESDPNFTIVPAALDISAPYQSPQGTIIRANTSTSMQYDPFAGSDPHTPPAFQNIADTSDQGRKGISDVDTEGFSMLLRNVDTENFSMLLGDVDTEEFSMLLGNIDTEGSRQS
ncbi:hypothetical protein TEQG_08085 [Trichophyton equinum CBS 127.97]|uniref:Uncharacterized protein n=1 Tax=Trichophyton equinum (strain ATCC MYA-4606 / CBS 127.97) TaxID=559882 RepID=F2Q4I9_TRIEC|nr:hypothetical protein TEQG_08085 [Trichophyton equinum CBS 127.97]